MTRKKTTCNHKWLTKRLIYRISLFVLLCLVSFLSLNALVDWDQAGFLFETQSKPVIAALTFCGTIVLCGLLCFVHLFFQRCNRKGTYVILGLMTAAAFALQCYFLFHVRSLYLFDNAFVAGGASTLAFSEGVAKQAEYYFGAYPNQNAYIVLTAFLWNIGSRFGMARGQIPYLLNAVNMICLDSAFVLVYGIFCKGRPQKTLPQKATFATLLLLNPFLYIGVCYYYTITLSMPFFMAILYLFVAFVQPDKKTPVSIWIYMGILFALGYLMRATTVIPMIAILFVMLYFGPRKKEMLLMLLISIVCIMGVGRANERFIGLDTTDTSFPATHWVMMSLTSPGCHNAEDESYTAGFATQEEKKEAVSKRIQEKLRAMSTGDMAELLVAKLKNTWGDGSNGYTVYLENCVGTDGPYEYIYGQHKDGVLWYHQIYYLLLLLLFLCQLVKSLTGPVDREHITLYVWQLTFLGGILFYLIWETSGQYSLPFLPVLLLGAVGGWSEEPQTEHTRVYHQQTEHAKSDNQQAGQDRVENAQAKHAQTSKQQLSKELAVSHKKQRADRYRMAALCCLYLLSALFLLAFWIRKYPVFTLQEHDFEHPVVRQVLGNDEIRIGGKDTLVQTFETAQPFNRILFQYTNPNEETDAVFEMKLTKSGAEEIDTYRIPLKDAPARQAVILDFETVIPEGKQQYQITFRQLTGSEDAQLGIITYQMGHYDAYPKGELSLSGETTESEMVFGVSETTRTAYAGRPDYLLAGIVFCTIVFLPIFVILVYTIPYRLFSKTEKSPPTD